MLYGVSSYWYYVARTQQQLAKTAEAVQTFQRLTEMATATSTGPYACQQHGQHGIDSGKSARSRGTPPQQPARLCIRLCNWESNLVCAWVLADTRSTVTRKIRISRTSMSSLKWEQSTVALVSLYYHSADKAKLKSLLDDKGRSCGYSYRLHAVCEVAGDEGDSGTGEHLSGIDTDRRALSLRSDECDFCCCREAGNSMMRKPQFLTQSHVSDAGTIARSRMVWK